MTLYEIVQDAIDELREWRDENPDDDEPHDRIFEIADSAVPVYTADLLRLAVENIALATDEPEIGPAFDGTSTPTNIIAANVFKHVEAALWEAWQEMIDKENDADEDAA